MAEHELFVGQDQRSGIVDRRKNSARAAGLVPTILSAVSVPTKGTYGPGQESAFLDAVNEVNEAHKKAGKEGVLVDLERLTKVRAVSGFSGAGQASEQKFTRNRQLDGASESQTSETGADARVREMENDRALRIPGGQPLDVVHPLSPTQADQRSQAAQFGRPVVAAGGEKAATEAAAQGSAGTGTARTTPATSSGDGSTAETTARRGGASRPSRGGAGRTRTKK